ncbi:MAG: iron ABC transporter permease, partial [Saccharospirillum sp.]
MTTHFLLRSSSEKLALAFHRQTLWRCLALLGLTLVILLVNLGLGSTTIPPQDIIATLLSPETSEHRFVVHALRLPRALLALLVGAGLGVSGALLQQIVRNPLASPDIIGISDGAALGAVLFLAWLAGSVSLTWLPPVAIAAAAVTATVIYGLAWTPRSTTAVAPIRLVLVGIALAAALKAVATLVLVMSPLSTTVQAYIWLTGTVYGAQWQDVTRLLPWPLVLIPVALLAARALTLLGMNDEQSRGLGLAVGHYRLLLLACSVGLAGSAVAFAGGMAFVGLMAPHLARRITGQTSTGLILGAALTGACLVLLADLIGRTAFLPQDLPAGIFVSGVGAPFFIYLLYRRRS